jgi:hypothetical protein
VAAALLGVGVVGFRIDFVRISHDLLFFLPSAHHMRQPGFASNLAAALQAPELGDGRLRVTPHFKANFTNNVHTANPNKTTLYRFYNPNSGG